MFVFAVLQWVKLIPIQHVCVYFNSGHVILSACKLISYDRICSGNLHCKKKRQKKSTCDLLLSPLSFMDIHCLTGLTVSTTNTFSRISFNPCYTDILLWHLQLCHHRGYDMANLALAKTPCQVQHRLYIPLNNDICKLLHATQSFIVRKVKM